MPVRFATPALLCALVFIAGGCRFIAGYDEVQPIAQSDAAVADANDLSLFDGALDQAPPCPDGGCPPPPTQIAAAGHYSCALSDIGRVLCWGRNEYGQLGRGTFDDGHIPEEVIKEDGNVIEGARRIALSAYHACALVGDGVYCWGANWSGQVGVEFDTPAGDRWVLPVAVAVEFGMERPRAIVDIDAWEDETCALDDDGSIWCWGNEPNIDYGPTPTKRDDITGAQHLACGGFHCCAANANSDITCWGRDWSGQATPPATSLSGKSIVQLAAGGDFNCALFDEGNARAMLCWGEGWSGQFGAWEPDITGTIVSLPFAAERLALGSEHSCAIDAEKTVHCWGKNLYGQLGRDDEKGRDVRAPLESPIHGLSAEKLACGQDHCCAITPPEGQIACWGRNVAGQLGLGAHRVEEPQLVDDNITSVWAGANHTCATMSDNSVHCWGANAYGQLGDNSPAPLGSATITAPSGSAIAPSTLGLGARHSCGTWEGATYCWGEGEGRQTGDDNIPILSPLEQSAGNFPADVSQLAAGSRHSCALDIWARIFCWGDNLRGQLGTEDVRWSASPLSVDPMSGDGIVDLVSAGHTTCAHDSVDIYCWGLNGGGQAGFSAGSGQAPPYYVSPETSIQEDFINEVHAIALGPGHGCAVVDAIVPDGRGGTSLSNGNIACWGENYLGELGPQIAHHSGMPISLLEESKESTTRLTGFTAVAAGVRSSCGAKSDSTVWCWGDDLSHITGPVGDAGPIPRQVFELPNPGATITKLVAGHHHVCALTSAQRLYCWGENSLGQLGSQHRPTRSTRTPFFFRLPIPNS